MDTGSDEENPIKSSGNANKAIDNLNDGHVKPKRQMKTPFQLETLEKVYAVDTYPSEAKRAELSEKLGLTDRQLQMWFCHRRLKEKKETPPRKPRKAAVVQPPALSPVHDLRVGSVPDPVSGSESGSGSGSGCSPFTDRKLFASGGSISSRVGLGEYESMGRRNFESRQSIMELRAIDFVEGQLGEPLREDGPILGMEFDPLPPGAFGAPIEPQKHSGYPYQSKKFERHNATSSKTQTAARTIHEHRFPEDPSCFRSDTYGQVARTHFHDMEPDASQARTPPFVHGNEPLSRSQGVHGHVPRLRSTSQQVKPSAIFSIAHDGDSILSEREPITNNRIIASSGAAASLRSEDPYLSSDGAPMGNDVQRKGKNDEARFAKEMEENRIRRELEKLELQRRKNEERMRKEMERHERERRKEEERLMRERQREEERSKREQKREMERREKFLQKEYQRAEKRRQKEELRREKEAARRKIAIEKATARRIAKESMDLIEDEQLELMELAAANKDLPSILHLDHDTLQNLDSFTDSLSTFPPKSVRLKRPFVIQPWKDSEENVGNLLMAWRFLISFSDVLGLWPFTLDEFIQGFHDYDSRLLGEIHIALLKSIIKDIEDVARAPLAGLGMNQYFTAHPEGGHLQIVEGACAWGFDIRTWQKHLNLLTWHEILRQLAISAGFGPRLKKQSSKWTYLCDDDEVKGCENVITTIRNGSAAENAFALMRDKGLLLPRRSRHRLTPGTVKFAAFHVLSLEGGKGLTVLELADKIQKSGLRDLTTSKTPEASISVALTRDTKLFERIAPSTYCVRAPYRKDPADAESVLAEARKKIRAFENGFTAAEDAEDVERDEDFVCDVDEDPEVDEFATPSNAAKVADDDEANIFIGCGKHNICDDVATDVQNDLVKDLSSLPSSSTKNINASNNTGEQTAGEDAIGIHGLDYKTVQVDESNKSESWVQGLTEGDYSYLSVEERLNALVALISVANEGNSIRAVLEDRMEAANSLKKQMWAEAQVDKSRMKDIIKLDFVSFGTKTEQKNGMPAVQSPSHAIDNKSEAPYSFAEDRKTSELISNDLRNFPAEKNSLIQDANMDPDNFSTQIGCSSKRLRSQLKSYIGHRAEEMYAYRSLPLGQDRRRNRYWLFAASASRNNPCCGRIFVELHDGRWRLLDTKEAFEALVKSLDMRGIRESHLRLMLQKIEAFFKENVYRNLQPAGKTVKNEAAETDPSPYPSSGFYSPSSAVCGLNPGPMETSNSFRVEFGKNGIEKNNLLLRYQDFQQWVWLESYNSLASNARRYGTKRCTQVLVTCELCLDSYFLEYTHCTCCHQTLDTFNGNFRLSEHRIQCEGNKESDTRDVCSMHSPPPGIRLLKVLIAFIEASVPAEALESFWTEDERKNWGLKLNASSSSKELLQVLTLFENAIKKEYLSADFRTTKELLGTGTLLRTADDDPDSVPVLPWIPLTVSAVALRVLELDASIKYLKKEKTEPSPDMDDQQYLKLPSRCSPLQSKDMGLREEDQDETMKVADMGSKRDKRGRGGFESASGRKSQRKKLRAGLNSDYGKRNSRANESLTLNLKQQGRGLSNRGCGRGRRTVRKRAERKNIDDVNNNSLGPVADIVRPQANDEESFRNFVDEWPAEEAETPNRMMDAEGGLDDEDDDGSNSIEAVESDDNAQHVEYDQNGNWVLGYGGNSNAWNGSLNKASDVEDDEDDDDDDDDDDEVDDGNGFEPMRDEDLDDDIEMSQSSDDEDIIANNTRKNDDREFEDSDDYSDS